MHANMPQFGKRTQLTQSHFAEFEAAFGDDPLGNLVSLAKRKDTGDRGRFRRFTRDWIADRNENLDIAWLRDEYENGTEELPEPTALDQEAMLELEAAIAELQGILAELGEEVVEL
jgi:type I restriction enzyme M protein